MERLWHKILRQLRKKGSQRLCSMLAEVGMAKVWAVNIKRLKQLSFQKITFTIETEKAVTGRYWSQVDTCRL